MNRNALENSEAYIISLSDDLYESAVEKLEKTGIRNFKKFNAISGSTLTDFVKNPNYVSVKGYYDISIPVYRNAHSDLGSINAVGCYMSHVKIWEKIIHEKLSGSFIFESDAVCDENLFLFTELFLKKPNPHIIFFGYFGNVIKDVGPISKLNGRFLGMHSYYITNEGAKLFLKNAFPIEQQIDSYISDIIMLSQEHNSIIEEVNIYITDNICIQNNTKGTSIQTKSVIEDNYITGGKKDYENSYISNNNSDNKCSLS